MRLFGHPAHPALVHFPIALCSTSLLGDGAGLLLADPFWHRLAFWCLTGGLVLSVPAVTTGLIAFFGLPEDDEVRTTGIWHMMIILTALALFGASLAIRGGDVPVTPAARWGGLALSAAGTLALFAGAWYGGELVFRHGAGREEPAVPLPQRRCDAK